MNNNYTEWIEKDTDYCNGFDSLTLSECRNNIKINVHSKFPLIEINLKENIIAQIRKLENSHQMYFYSLYWLLFTDKNLYRNEINIILNEIIEYSISTLYQKDDFCWDDHAISERISVLLEIIEDDDFYFDRKKTLIHLESLYKTVLNFLDMKKFEQNNHKIFHYCAIISFNSYHLKDSIIKVNLEELENSFKQLIDIKTGFSFEQAISYYNFDLILLRRVEEFLKSISLNFYNLSYLEIFNKNRIYLSLLSFPDGSLPSSGDTPIDYKINEADINMNNKLGLYKNLDLLGHYRGSSKDDKIHYHFLKHNNESTHGHKSPLHIDLWWEEFGEVLVDSGGPYKYGDKLRFSWFTQEIAHNCVHFDTKNNLEKEYIYINRFNDHTFDGARISEENYHYRSLSSINNLFLIEDKIISNSEWILSFHFQVGIDCYMLNQKNSFEIINKEGNKLLFTINGLTEDIEVELKKTYRTKVNPRKLLANSIILAGKAGSYQISTQFRK